MFPLCENSPTHTLNSCPFLIYICALTLYLKTKFTTKTRQNSDSSSYTLFKKSNCSITTVNIFQNTFSLTLEFPKSTEFKKKKHQDDNHAVLVASSTNQEWPLFPGLGSHHMDSGHRLKRLGPWVYCHLTSSLSHFGSENLNMETTFPWPNSLLPSQHASHTLLKSLSSFWNQNKICLFPKTCPQQLFQTLQTTKLVNIHFKPLLFKFTI